MASVDRDARTVTSASGRTVGYDRLLIATGSDPFIIPVPGRDLPGVISFRDMKDVDAMVAAAGAGGDAVVIGGGLLGLEAAHGLTLRGMKGDGAASPRHAYGTPARRSGGLVCSRPRSKRAARPS